jgi:type IV pilus assembly protein PilM
MLFKKENPIGLDIGSSYIKIVRIDDSKSGKELSLFDMAPIPFGAVEDGVVADKTALTNALKGLLKKNGIKSGGAVVGVSGHSSVIIKRITIPLMSEEELALSIQVEAEQYVPFDINDVNIDFQILGKNPDEDSQMDVVLVAVKKEVVNDYCAIVEGAGLEPVIVDVDSFALGNMYESNYDDVEEGALALINIGSGITNISILKNGQPVFTRDSAVGSNYHTEALEHEFGVNREDAERLKKGQLIEGVPPEAARLAIASASDEIFSEIYRSFEFYKSTASDGDIHKIILSGGPAVIEGFAEMTADRIGIPVEIADPFKKINISAKLDSGYVKANAAIAAVAVGLALRKVGDR